MALELKIPAEELAGWLTPSEALRILDAAYGKTHISKDELLTRLEAGLVVAAAGSSITTFKHHSQDYRDREPTRESFVYVPSDVWRFFPGADNADFWVTATAPFSLGRMYGTDYYATSRYFDVRFEPNMVRQVLASAPKKEAPESIPIATDEQPSNQEDPPVSDEDLRQWHALYRRAYQGSDDTLANAYKSARGMFPGKFVSRDRVRKLTGGRIRGRKPGNSDGD